MSAMSAEGIGPLEESLDLGVRTVEVMLTTGCNLRCAYCYQQRRAPRAMAPAVLDAAIRRLISCRRERPRLTFFGGEPLLAPALVRRALDRVREWSPSWMRADVQIVTNGTRLDDGMARLLVSRDVFITLSFDGVSAAQDGRSPGSFEGLDRLLVRLRRNHPGHFRRRLGLLMTLTARNVPFLGESFRYFLSRGIREVDVVPVFSDRRAWRAKAACELDQQLTGVLTASIEEFRRSGVIPFRPFRGASGRRSVRDGPVCACGSRELLFVDVDGSIAPCAALASSTLGSPPAAIRRFVAAASGLHVMDPDLSAGLLQRKERVGRLPFLASPVTRQGPESPCARCRFRSQCFVCPLAVAHNSGKVPALHCDVNRLFARYRSRFHCRTA